VALAALVASLNMGGCNALSPTGEMGITPPAAASQPASPPAGAGVVAQQGVGNANDLLDLFADLDVTGLNIEQAAPIAVILLLIITNGFTMLLLGWIVWLSHRREMRRLKRAP